MTEGRHGAVLQLSTSNGGVPKHPIEVAEIGPLGIEGDRQRDRRAHGGSERALCLWANEIVDALQREGHDVYAGATGENVTTSGVDWRVVVPGARLRLGDTVLVEVTEYASPCWKNARWFRHGNFDRMSQATHPGWSRVYAKVLEGGTVRPGDPIEVLAESAGERLERQRIRTYRWPRDFPQTVGLG